MENPLGFCKEIQILNGYATPQIISILKYCYDTLCELFSGVFVHNFPCRPNILVVVHPP